MHRDRDRGFGGMVPVLGRLLSSSCMCAWGGWVLVGKAFEGRIWQPSPHQICSLSEATDRVRFSAVSTLSEQDEETCVPSSSRVPHFGATLSQSLLCSSHPPSVLTSTAHNHHPSQISHTHSAPPSGHNRCRDFLEPETLISSPRSRT